MNLKKTTSTFATVKKLLCTLLLLSNATALAQGVTVVNEGQKDCGSFKVWDGEQKKCVPDLGGKCDDLRDKAKEAMAKVNENCGAAGISSGKCSDQIAKCVGESSKSAGTGNGFDLNPVLNQIAPAFGLPAMNLPGSQPAGVTAGCPSQNARDYFDDKERIDRDIKQTQTEITDVSTEIADEKEKLDKMMQDAQKQLSEAQKAVRANERTLDASKREQIGEQQKQQSEAANGLRTASRAMLAKRQEMASYDEKYTMELAQYTNELAKLTCMDQVQKKRAELVNLIPASSGGAGFLQAGNERRAALESMWNTCISTVRQQRLAKMNERKRYMEAAGKELEQMQMQIDEGNQALTTYNQQMQESMQAIEKQKTEGQQELYQEMQQAQQALVSAQQTTQQRQQSLMTKQQAAQARLATLQQDLAKLGPAPERGVTKSWRDAQSSYLSYLTEAEAYYDECCRNSAVRDHKKSEVICGTDLKRTRRQLEGGK